MMSRTRSLVYSVILMGFVFESSAFWIKGGEEVHQDITREILSANGNHEIPLGNGKTATFNELTLIHLGELNALTDKDQTAKKHFDDETFVEGTQRLKDLRDLFVATLVSPRYFKVGKQIYDSDRAFRSDQALRIMGEALHTVQDFYSHTNWVEKYGSQVGHDGINLLDVFGKDLLFVKKASSCNQYFPGTSDLTSGYANVHENDLTGGSLALCILEEGEENLCAHGFTGEVNIGDAVSCGINKDYSGRGDIHFLARAMAASATREYVNEALKEVLRKSKDSPALKAELGALGAKQAGISAVCHFMGVLHPFQNCFDQNLLEVELLGDQGAGGWVETQDSFPLLEYIHCGDICAASFPGGIKLKLEAKTNPGTNFVKWESPCRVVVEGIEQDVIGSKEPVCEVAMNSNKIAKAVFEQPCNKFQQHVLAGTGRWMLTLYQDSTRSIPRQQEYYEFYDTGRFKQYRLVFYDQEGNVTSDLPRNLTAPWTLGSCDNVALLTLNGFVYFDIPPDLPNLLIGFYSRGDNVMDMIRLN